MAVVRNVEAVWPTADRRKKRCLVTDREYTSPALAIRLHRMGYDLLGTCQKTRKGFPNAIKLASKERPAGMPRGTCRIVKHKKVHESTFYCFANVFDMKCLYFGVFRSIISTLSVGQTTSKSTSCLLVSAFKQRMSRES